MTKKYQQDGVVQSYTNATGAAIAAGAVVKMQNTVGVALSDIAIGETGQVQVKGVFRDIPKTAGTAWVHGDVLVWDVSTGTFAKGITPATGDVSGVCTAYGAAASGDTAASVLFHGIPGAIA
jgi:predicted RecA/RadA family phage recombinase